MRMLRLLSSAFLLAALLAAVPAPAGARAAPGARVALPQLVDVRAVHRAGVDRVIFRFDAGAPTGVDVRFVDRLLGDGSGLPIRVAGRAILQVGLHLTRTDAASPAPCATGVRAAQRHDRGALGSLRGLDDVRHRAGEADQGRGARGSRRATGSSSTVGAAFPTVDRQVFFLDEDRFVANQEPYFVPRTRPVPLGSPATGVMDRLFAGPLDRERTRGCGSSGRARRASPTSRSPAASPGSGCVAGAAAAAPP